MTVPSVPKPASVRSLYRNLLRNAKQIPNYNFREHAVRKIKYDFNKNKKLEAEALIEQYQNGIKELNVVKRQAIIGQLYYENESVVAHYNKSN